MRIAVVDDDPNLCELVAKSAQGAGFAPRSFGDAESLIRNLTRESYDVFLIDWVLPRNSGLELIRVLRTEKAIKAPIIVITARDAEADVVEALESGADDYVIKPIRVNELLARIRAVLRRTVAGSDSDDSFTFDRFRFDRRTLQAMKAGTPVEMTQKEFHLAVLLLRNIGKPLSRSHILESVWGRDTYVPSRTMDTHISRVRSKLDLRPEHGYLLAPVYSFGYRLEKLPPGDGANAPESA
jgi:DNA-binding response OmpR family regulator